jgi:hypothetical protein
VTLLMLWGDPTGIRKPVWSFSALGLSLYGFHPFLAYHPCRNLSLSICLTISLAGSVIGPMILPGHRPHDLSSEERLGIAALRVVDTSGSPSICQPFNHCGSVSGRHGLTYYRREVETLQRWWRHFERSDAFPLI